ncbi:DUF4389 domain-containing protein [Saccharophagus degradans]|uniref:DUF4389 domain-containing protein n=1 Tax=Saccharophagus degradans TaxID=86304 RepID=A0AAW7XAN4_9GAMM|nr:DUF4389 domain-containing protein [Saccharophagus degradans]MBU2987555.1 DUF4389 domain-containing protein [Saccharophagus degradans]MDO6424728.1 DUF4389 domain-containing protein [Saccharophagus degradans]MDO6609520.1 DUF4389 domain-containing protein [Saccharophagus degradans]
MNTQTIDQDQLRSNITNQRHWARLVYMLIIGIALHFSGILMWVLCVLQFLFTLFTGQDNDHLRNFAASLTRYINRGLKFVSYNSEHKPFPFEAWNETPVGTNQRNTAPQREQESDIIDVDPEPVVDEPQTNETNTATQGNTQGNTEGTATKDEAAPQQPNTDSTDTQDKPSA